MARRLTRNTREAVLAGVAAGFADHFDLDPILVRLGFIFLCFFGGTGFALYVVSWVLMPRDTELEPRSGDAPSPGRQAPTEPASPESGDGAEIPPVERVAREASEVGERVVDTLKTSFPEGPGRGRLIMGSILIGLGMLFLADRFLPIHWWWIWDMWPLTLIAVGLLMLLNARRGAEG